MEMIMSKWENVDLRGLYCSGGKMDKNTISIVWNPAKNSCSLTLNGFLNEPIEDGKYFYFGMKRETTSGRIVILLQNYSTATNVRMVSTKKKSQKWYNYGIRSRCVVAAVREALGLQKDGIARIRISDNISENADCMLFDVFI